MTSDLEQLARWRTIGARHSEEVYELGLKVLKSKSAGDQEWAIREQLAMAALDLGRVKVATEQLSVLERRFSGSPRVALILGLRFEAQGETAKAKRVYEELLGKDETNVVSALFTFTSQSRLRGRDRGAIHASSACKNSCTVFSFIRGALEVVVDDQSAHQRLISMATSTPATAIPLLLSYLDTFYTDPAGWSLLAELYADQGLYGQSLTALGHVMVLQSWDSGAVCRAGETAYTISDYQLALKYFLRAIEMQTDPSHRDGSKKTRAWWGVKLSARRLLDGEGETTVPAEQATSEAQLKKLEELATERLLAVGGAGLGLKRNVLAAPTTIR